MTRLNTLISKSSRSHHNVINIIVSNHCIILSSPGSMMHRSSPSRSQDTQRALGQEQQEYSEASPKTVLGLHVTCRTIPCHFRGIISKLNDSFAESARYVVDPDDEPRAGVLRRHCRGQLQAPTKLIHISQTDHRSSGERSLVIQKSKPGSLPNRPSPLFSGHLHVLSVIFVGVLNRRHAMNSGCHLKLNALVDGTGS
jgi:hypothetical protein